MRLVHDPERCTGHGRCYALAGDLLEDDEFGHGVVVGDGTLDADQVDSARRAVDACPEGAITIVDD